MLVSAAATPDKPCSILQKLCQQSVAVASLDLSFMRIWLGVGFSIRCKPMHGAVCGARWFVSMAGLNAVIFFGRASMLNAGAFLLGS